MARSHSARPLPIAASILTSSWKISPQPTSCSMTRKSFSIAIPATPRKAAHSKPLTMEQVTMPTQLMHKQDKKTANLPLQMRTATLAVVNTHADESSNQIFRVTWTTGATVRRYDWENDRMYDEELVVEPGTVRMD